MPRVREIVRRYFAARCAKLRGTGEDAAIGKIEILMEQAAFRRRTAVLRAKPTVWRKPRQNPPRRWNSPTGSVVTGKPRICWAVPAPCCSTPSRPWPVSGRCKADLRAHHRAHPALEDHFPGQSQPAPAHGRGAHRPFHLRRGQRIRRPRHRPASQPGGAGGARKRPAFPRRRGYLPAPRRQPHLSAQARNAAAVLPLSAAPDRRPARRGALFAARKRDGEGTKSSPGRAERNGCAAALSQNALRANGARMERRAPPVCRTALPGGALRKTATGLFSLRGAPWRRARFRRRLHAGARALAVRHSVAPRRQHPRRASCACGRRSRLLPRGSISINHLV